MAVHMFRVFIGRGKMSASDLESRINDWVESNAEWTEDPTDHTLTETNTKMDGSGATYYRADVRFELTDAKANLLQKFTDKLEQKVAWYRVGYHRCDHDESGHQGCSFDPAEDPEALAEEWTAKDVTVPDGVPDFPDAAYEVSV